VARGETAVFNMNVGFGGMDIGSLYPLRHYRKGINRPHECKGPVTTAGKKWKEGLGAGFKRKGGRVEDAQRGQSTPFQREKVWGERRTLKKEIYEALEVIKNFLGGP